MKTEPLTLDPYRAVGPIRFGATIAEVGSVLGAPEFIRTTSRREREERRGPITVTYSSGGGVAEVTLHEPAQLIVSGVDLFQARESYRQLLEGGHAALESLGLLVIPEIGVSLGGFHSDELLPMSVTCFEHGRFDRLLPSFRPFEPG